MVRQLSGKRKRYKGRKQNQMTGKDFHYHNCGQRQNYMWAKLYEKNIQREDGKRGGTIMLRHVLSTPQAPT